MKIICILYIVLVYPWNFQKKMARENPEVRNLGLVLRAELTSDRLIRSAA